MGSLTESCPKPLLRIGGVPLIEHIASRLPREVDEFIVVVGYLGHMIRDYCGDEFLGRRVRYVEDTELKGTYRALEMARPYLVEGERFFVLYADDIHGAYGLRECLKYERALLVSWVEDPRPYGVVELGRDNFVHSIEEKPENPKTNIVSTGVLLLDTNIFKYKPRLHPAKNEYFLAEAVADMLVDYPIAAVTSSLWLPVTTPEDLTRTEQVLPTTIENMADSGPMGRWRIADWKF